MVGFVGTHPTGLGCALVDAPHSLLVQSREDLEGAAHADGWGIAQWGDDGVSVMRHLGAAHEGEDYRDFARTVRARQLIAHVRQATSGDVCFENTHPFVHGPWVFVHNGTIRHFDEGVKEAMSHQLAPRHRGLVQGSTDSEVLFHLLLSRMAEQPARAPVDILAETIRDVAEWCEAAGPCENLGLSVLLGDGNVLLGARWQQSLWMLERERVSDTELCGAPHDEREAPQDYRAVLVASEPLTQESWQPIPERCVFDIEFGTTNDAGPGVRIQRIER